jgi:hypothetical protein
MIENLNMRATIARQDNKCLKCKNELPTGKNDQVYFIMRQHANDYRVYCMECGNNLTEKEKYLELSE